MMATCNIGKLNATNYANWYLKLKYLLLEKGTWNVIEGWSKLVPVCFATVTDTDIASFKARANLALSTIKLNMETYYKKIVETCDIVEKAKVKLLF